MELMSGRSLLPLSRCLRWSGGLTRALCVPSPPPHPRAGTPERCPLTGTAPPKTDPGCAAPQTALPGQSSDSAPAPRPPLGLAGGSCREGRHGWGCSPLFSVHTCSSRANSGTTRKVRQPCRFLDLRMSPKMWSPMYRMSLPFTPSRSHTKSEEPGTTGWHDVGSPCHCIPLSLHPSVTASLCHCIPVPPYLCHCNPMSVHPCATASQCHCIPVLLHSSVTASHCHCLCVTASPRYCTSLHPSATASLCHCIPVPPCPHATASLYYCNPLSLNPCTTVSLCHHPSVTMSQCHYTLLPPHPCATASLYQCIPVPPRPSTTVVTQPRAHHQSRQHSAGGAPCRSQHAASPCPVSTEHPMVSLHPMAGGGTRGAPVPTVLTWRRTVPSAKKSGLRVSTTMRSK